MSTNHSNLARIPALIKSPANFVSGLPKIPLTDLPNDECDKRCSICREDFVASPVAEGNEEPVSLPCGHIFGEHCLLAFLSIRATSHTCPLCRVKLPTLADESRRGEDYVYFLSWIALNYRYLGADLDRQYGVLKAIDQAHFYFTAVFNCYDVPISRLDATNQRYIALMHRMADLDDESPTSWRTLEEIQEQLDEVMQQVEESQLQRPILYLSPWVGRKIRIMNFALETDANPLEEGLEEGEIIEAMTSEAGSGIPEYASLESVSLPAIIRGALQDDFAGLSSTEIWNTLRSRRFALDLHCRFSQTNEQLLEKLVSYLYVSDEIIAEYARDTAFRERAPRRERRWQLNAGGDTLEYIVDYY